MSGELFASNDINNMMVRFHKISKIWDEIGLDEEMKRKRTHTIHQLIKDQIDEIEHNEKQLKINLITSIDEKGLKLHQLTTAMHINTITEPDSNLTLIELNKFLERKVADLEAEAKERTKKFEELKKQEKELAERLSEDLCEVPPDRIPSDETIQHISRVIRSLTAEKDSRLRTYRTLKLKIVSLMDDLDLDPTSPLEVNLVSGHEDMFVLSISNIKEIKQMEKNFQAQIKEVKMRETDLLNKIKELWRRLETSEDHQELFINHLHPKAICNLNILEKELNTLEDHKRRNLGQFINKLRRELEECWDLCFIGEDEKEDFAPYFSDDYTEENLELHEQEVSRMKKFYSDNENIFKKIVRWQGLWKKVTELEDKGRDAKRLFGNRGCSLLQEEKERKRVNTQLPRVEKEIKNEIDAWEAENGRPFTVCGQSLTDYITSKWEEFNHKKMQEKQIRQSVRTKQLERDALLGTTAVKTPVGKRRNTAREVHQTSKYLRTNDSERKPGVGCTINYSSSLSRCSSRNNLLSPMTPQRNTMTRRAAQKGSTHNRSPMHTLNSSEIGSYMKFTEDIHKRSERENVRSSVVPEKFCRSPVKGPRGLPKTPMSMTSRYAVSSSNRRPLTATTNQINITRQLTPSTLPRRRSARINSLAKSGAATCARKQTAMNSPSLRTTIRATFSSNSKAATPNAIRSKLSFLM